LFSYIFCVKDKNTTNQCEDEYDSSIQNNIVRSIMGKLDGKIALITGGSDGIGLATAQRFIAEGAEHVFITGRRQNALDEAVKKINSEHVTAVQGDVSNMADLDRLYNLIGKQKGRLDILFANAAIFETESLISVTEKHFDDTFNINVKGLLFTVQKALPIFTDGGSIILNASVGSIKGYPNESVYSASKAAVRSFARCWTVDLKDRRIRVNALSPGAIDTPILRNAGNTEEEQNAYINQCAAVTPMNRIGTPDEIAKAAVFLASNDSSYITGIELFVDGGMGQI
jgi:NAD(P)-dependent dehydrogenase (short-subunit alcohol dehydrogenase family)